MREQPAAPRSVWGNRGFGFAYPREMNSPSLSRALPILAAIGAMTGGLVLVGPHGARDAEASCMAPRFAFVRQVRVTRCEVLDPMAQPEVNRFVTAMADPANARAFVDGY